MKKILGSILVLIILGMLGFLFQDEILKQTQQIVAYSPCSEPKAYSIGRVDSEFGITTDDFSEAIENASAIWGNAYGHQLFDYDPQATFTINLIYDNRQTLNTEINQKNADLRVKDSELRPKIEAYNKKSVDLQARIKKLNEEIETWNSQGGAPDDVYKRLRTEQSALRIEMAALNQEADNLSLSTDELKDEAATLEDTVTTFNDALHDKPEGGKYILDQAGERIDIAIFDNTKQLENVLAHELGHALGMEHVKDTDSIMYEKTNNALAPTNQDFMELTKACAKQNLIMNRLTVLRSTFFERLGNFISFESSN